MTTSAAPSPLPPEPTPPPFAVPDDYADSGARAIDLSSRPVADSLREIMASSPRLPRDQPPPLPPGDLVVPNRHGTLAIVGLAMLLAAMMLAGEAVWRVVTSDAVTGGVVVGEAASGTQASVFERTHLLIDTSIRVVAWTAIGLGMILARRWARHVLLAGLLGVLLSVMQHTVAVAVNQRFDVVHPGSGPTGSPAWQVLTGLGVAGGLAWGLLAVLRHRHVRLTCELAQPVGDWTDRRSPSELLLMLEMFALAAAWSGWALQLPWPYWGVWRTDLFPWVWSTAAALAALAGCLVACGRGAGSWLALLVVGVTSSSLIITATRNPAETFHGMWGDWRFNERGGLAYLVGGTLILSALAITSWSAQRRRRTSAPTRAAPNPHP